MPIKTHARSGFVKKQQYVSNNTCAFGFCKKEKKKKKRLLSPFLTGRMFLREPSWKYSANLVGS